MQTSVHIIKLQILINIITFLDWNFTYKTIIFGSKLFITGIEKKLSKNLLKESKEFTYFETPFITLYEGSAFSKLMEMEMFARKRGIRQNERFV